MLVFCFSPNRYTWLADIICLMGSVVISAWIVFPVAFLIAWPLENVHQDEVAAYHSSQEHGLLNKTAWVQISALSLVSTMSLGKQLAFHSSLIKCRQKIYSVLWLIRSFAFQLLSLWLFPVDCSTPVFSVLHYLLEFSQTHVHWASDTIQPSHPLLPSSTPALNPSQYQGLFQWVGSSHQMVKVLELQLWHRSGQWISRLDFQ